MTDNGICGIVDAAVRRVLNMALDEDGHVMVPVTDATDNPLSVSAGEKPAVFKEFTHDIAVWPVFKGWNDGMAENIPLSEIARHENSFMSAPEEVLRRMDCMVRKFIEETGGEDVTIVNPFKTELNQLFSDAVAQKCGNLRFADNYFFSVAIEEVDDYVFEENSFFCTYFRGHYTERHEELVGYFREMYLIEPYWTFKFSKIKNPEMRTVIEQTIKQSDELHGKYIEALNDRNILIIDDSLFLMRRFRETCGIIANAYVPKSITVMSLFPPYPNETEVE